MREGFLCAKSFCVGASIYFLCVVAGTPEAAEAGTLFQNLTLQQGSYTRTYHLYVPEELPASPLPLVFVLHGGLSSADELLGLPGNAAPESVWLDVAEREKYIMVIPNAVPADPNNPDTQSWNDCRADCYSKDRKVDDVAFFDALLARVAEHYPINSERVYCYGVSNGGHMCLRLAHERSSKVAAVATTLAAEAAVSSCPAPEQPVPIMLLNGTADPLLPWNGGKVGMGLNLYRGTSLSVPDTVALWVGFNGTATAPTSTKIPDGPRRDGSTVTVETYGGGLGGAEVLLYRINGGGHVQPSIREHFAPGYEAQVGWQNHDIETAEEVWAFFNRHSLDARIEEPGAPVLQVTDLLAGMVLVKKGNKRATVAVQVKDSYGSPVAGASVRGTFRGDFKETVSAITDGSGTARLSTSATTRGRGHFGFCVTNVSHPDFPAMVGNAAGPCTSY